MSNKKTPTDSATIGHLLTRDNVINTSLSSPNDIIMIDIPAYNGHVYIRKLNGAGYNRYMIAFAQAPEQLWAILVAHTACDDKGVLLYRPADVPTLSQRPLDFLRPIATAVLRREKMLVADIVEDAVGKSEDVPSSNGGIDSPAPSA